MIAKEELSELDKIAVRENINSKRIILRVAAWNKRAISLYEKNGFEIVGKA